MISNGRQLEFVKDKVTKEPFDPGHKVAWKIHDLGESNREASTRASDAASRLDQGT